MITMTMTDVNDGWWWWRMMMLYDDDWWWLMTMLDDDDDWSLIMMTDDNNDWWWWLMNEWMNERCFTPLFCTVKAELGRGQPGLMRWIWDETCPRAISIARPSTLQPSALPLSYGRPPSSDRNARTPRTLLWAVILPFAFSNLKINSRVIISCDNENIAKTWVFYEVFYCL